MAPETHTVTTVYTDRDGFAHHGLILGQNGPDTLVIWTSDAMMWRPDSERLGVPPKPGDTVVMSHAYDMPDGEPVYRLAFDGSTYDATIDTFRLPDGGDHA